MCYPVGFSWLCLLVEPRFYSVFGSNWARVSPPFPACWFVELTATRNEGPAGSSKRRRFSRIPFIASAEVAELNSEAKLSARVSELGLGGRTGNLAQSTAAFSFPAPLINTTNPRRCLKHAREPVRFEGSYPLSAGAGFSLAGNSRASKNGIAPSKHRHRSVIWRRVHRSQEEPRAT